MDKGCIIITGSAGRIGTAVAKRLGQEYKIIGFEMLKAVYASKNEELVPVDLGSDESVVQAFKHIKDNYGTKIVAVVHLAAYYSFSNTSYEPYKKVTVEGTRRLLKALQEFDVEQFIFSGTMLVHKPCPIGKKITEKSPMEGSWAYPKSKIETEEVIHKTRGKIPAVTLRIAGVYDDLCHSIPIANNIQRIYEKQLVSHFFPGNLKAGASFVHMEDVVDAIVQCIRLRETLPKETAILIAEEDRLSTDALQRKISKLLFGKEMKTYRIPKVLAWIGAHFQRSFIKPWMVWLADDNYDIHIAKAKKLLQWEPKHRLEQSLQQMIQALKKDPKGWYKTNGLK